MRVFTAVVTVSLALLAAGTPASAQSSKTPEKPVSSEPNTHYFLSLGDILGDLPVDAFMKETRQGGKTLSAQLDVCFSVAVNSDRKDRFVVDLKPDGDKLTGTGTTTDDKAPVTVSLTRKDVVKSINFDGKITVGSKPFLVSSTDNAESDEKEFAQSQATDDNISEKPADFTDMSPQAIAVKVKRGNFIDLMKSLKTENVQITLDSIAADCIALRSGEQIVRLFVDPMRSAALVAKLKAMPGVTAAGWTTGSYDIERAIRVSAADWSSGGKLDRTGLATAIGNAAAKTYSAKIVSSEWNDTTGELTVTLKHPNTTAPALGLTDTLELTVLIGPEKPGASDRLIVWVGSPSTTTRDESAGPHLDFAEAASTEEESTFSEDDEIVRALAAELKGVRWSPDTSSWK